MFSFIGITIKGIIQLIKLSIYFQEYIISFWISHWKKKQFFC